MIVRISYTDHLSELSGDVELVVEDHNRMWQTSWYPGLGDEITLAIGYQGEGLLPCGDFQIDQLELTGPPDTFTMRCLAAFITPAMRTANSIGYEGQTLLGIAQVIAAKYGLSVISAPEVIDVSFERVTQKHETDLGFLKRLAVEYGYDFSVRGSVLVFYSVTALQAVVPTISVTRTDVERFEFRNRTHDTYPTAQVTYQNPFSKSLVVGNASTIAPIPTSDTIKMIARSENSQQALLKCEAALQATNMFFIEGILTMPGSIAMASGNTLQVSGFGEFDGIYIVLVARHLLDRAHGYVTRVEVSRVY